MSNWEWQLSCATALEQCSLDSRLRGNDEKARGNDGIALAATGIQFRVHHSPFFFRYSTFAFPVPPSQFTALRAPSATICRAEPWRLYYVPVQMANSDRAGRRGLVPAGIIGKGRPMRRIAVINQKGGVGKTTTTANLGAALAKAGRRVLLVDLDPQGHLSLHFGCEVAGEEPSVFDVLVNDSAIKDVARVIGKRTTVVPAQVDLAAAEAHLINTPGRELILRQALDAYDKPHDVLLIDCPPSLGVLTINALVASTEVMIPLQAHFLALQGLGKLLETVALVRQRINPELRVSGIVLCMHEQATKLAGEVVDDIRAFLESSRGTDQPWADAVLYETCIRRNIKLAEACSYGQTVFEYAPKSNGALDYANLALEMVRLEKAAAAGEQSQPRHRQNDDMPSELEQATDSPPDEAAATESTPAGIEPGDPQSDRNGSADSCPNADKARLRVG